MVMSIIVLDICRKGYTSQEYSNCGGIDFVNKNTQNKPTKMIFISLYPDVKIEADKNYAKNILIQKINSLKNAKYIVIACHTLSSCILDLLLKNNDLLNETKVFEPIIPMCIHIQKKKYKNILILSTPLTARIRWHARILTSKVKYITFDALPTHIDHNNVSSIHKDLERLSAHQHFLRTCDCVVLGCTHFNVIKKTISKYLHQNNFTGKILDSNLILHNYLKTKNLLL